MDLTIKLACWPFNGGINECRGGDVIKRRVIFF